MLFSRYSPMVCGKYQRHCVSRCAYGTTYSVGVLVISGAFIVWPRAGRSNANAASKGEAHRMRGLRLDFCLDRDMLEEPLDRIVEYSHYPVYRSRFRSICSRRELRPGWSGVLDGSGLLRR